MLKAPPAIRGVTIGFWVFSGFLIGLVTSIGARVLLCPYIEDFRGSSAPVVAPKPAKTPTASPSSQLSVPERLEMARLILDAAADSDGVWTEAHRLALQEEVALLPDKERQEIVHEMVLAFHSGKLRPE